MSHVPKVQAIYAAFARGDIPALLEQLSDDVEWEHDSVDHGVPWLKPGRGKPHVASSFATTGQAFDVKSFEVLNLLAGGDQVVAICRIDAAIRATGKPLRDYEAHVWTFGAAGKVTRFRHVVDTHQHLLASRH